jgi:hypothetical protein
MTDAQRAELEALGPEMVQAKLSQAGSGRGAAVAGFKTGAGATGYLSRGDIEDWLADKYAQERKQTLRWAKIAGWAAIISVIVGTAAIAVTIWLARH